MNDLPIIAVSAADVATAKQIISELIEKDASELDDAPVWELSNKYYTARARLRPLLDDEPGDGQPDAEAHLVYLAESECTDDVVLSSRVSRAGSSCSSCEVRLALCAVEEAGLPAPLRAAAHSLGYELVPLLVEAPPADPAGPFPELRGLARAREALHAHVWPGLQLNTRAPAFLANESAANGVSSESGSSADEAEDEDGEGEGPPSEAECVRRAEAFADALAALQAAAGAGGAAGGHEEGEAARAERLLRADQLLDAFCRALGTSPDLL